MYKSGNKGKSRNCGGVGPSANHRWEEGPPLREGKVIQLLSNLGATLLARREGEHEERKRSTRAPSKPPWQITVLSPPRISSSSPHIPLVSSHSRPYSSLFQNSKRTEVTRFLLATREFRTSPFALASEFSSTPAQALDERSKKTKRNEREAKKSEMDTDGRERRSKR